MAEIGKPVPKFLGQAAQFVQEETKDSGPAVSPAVGSIVRKFAVQEAQQQSDTRASFINKSKEGQPTAETLTQPKGLSQQIGAGIKEEFGEAKETAKGLVEAGKEFVQQKPGEIAKDVALAPVKLAEGLAKEVAGGGAQIVTGAFKNIQDTARSGDTAFKMTVDLVNSLQDGTFDTKTGKFPIRPKTQEALDREAPGRGVSEIATGISRIAGVAPSPAAQALAGGLSELATGVEEQKPLVQIGTEAAISAGERATLAFALNKFADKTFSKKTTKDQMVKQAKASGLDEQAINAVKNLTDDEIAFAKELTEQAEKAAKTAVEGGKKVKTPRDLVGDRLRTAQSSLKSFKAKAGQKVGEVKARLKQKTVDLDLDDVVASFKDEVEGLGGEFLDDGTINWAKSTVRRNAGDKSLLSGVWEDIKIGTKGADDIVNDVTAIGGDLFEGKVQQQIQGSSERIANNVRTGLKGKLEALEGELGPAYKEFSDLSDVTSLLDRKIGPTGTKAGGFIKRIFGGAGEETQALIDDVIRASKERGIKEGSNLVKDMQLALEAEKVFKVKRPTGLPGGVESAIQVAKAPSLIRKADILGGAIFDKIKAKFVPTQQQAFKNLIEKAPEGTISKLLNPKVAASEVVTELQALVPQLTKVGAVLDDVAVAEAIQLIRENTPADVEEEV